MPISCIVGRARNAEADLLEYGYVRRCESFKTTRISPWVERTSREPSDIAMNPPEVGSALRNRSVHLDRVGIFNPPPITHGHLCDLTCIQRESSTLKSSSRISLEDPRYRSQNPVMSTSHMDLSPVVRYDDEYVDR